MSPEGGTTTQAIAAPLPDEEQGQLESICSTVATLYGANHVSLWVYGAPAADTSSGIVSFAAGRRWDGSRLAIGADRRWASVPLPELPTFSSAITTGKPSTFDDGREATSRQKELIAALGTRSFDCEPVVFNGRSVGVMVIDPPRILDTERAILMPAIVEEAGFLLSKVEMAHYREEARFLLTLIGDATATRSLGHVLATVCTKLAGRLQSRHATVVLPDDTGLLTPVASLRADGTSDMDEWGDFSVLAQELRPQFEAWRDADVPLELVATGWWATGYGATGLIGASLHIPGEPGGVLVVDTTDSRRYTRAESYLLHEVAGLLGWMIGWAYAGPHGGSAGTQSLGAAEGVAALETERWLLGISEVEDRSTDDVVSAVCARAARLFATDVAYPVASGQSLETGYPALPPVRRSFETGEVATSEDLTGTFGSGATPVLRSVVAIPLGTGRRPWYVIACGNFSEPRPWTTSELTMAQQLSVEGSLRLEVARLARVDRHQVTSVARRLLRDPVTNLPNTVLLVDRIEQAIHRARRDRAPLSLICLDIQQLDELGDSLGAAGRDVLLSQVAERLVRSMRAADVVARVGDREFAVLLTTSATGSGTSIVVGKIRRVLSLPFEVAGEVVMIGVNTGVAVWPDQGDDPGSLLGNAFEAIRRAATTHPQGPPPGPEWSSPANGSGAEAPSIGTTPESLPTGGLVESDKRSETERPDLEAAPVELDESVPADARQRGSSPAPSSAEAGRIPPHVALADFPRAVENGQLVLHYLPKVSLSDGDVISMEALVRWNHPTWGLVQPAAFLPLVSDSELGWEVSRWVLNAALDQCAAWLTAGLSLAVSINISRYDVTAAPLIDEVHDALARTHLLGRHLTLEISEQAVIDELVRGSAAFVILRTEGVRISVDDCGSGKVAPLYLARMPVDEIKIDNRLLTEGDPSDIELVRDIVRLGHSFGIQITAEAIEERTAYGGMEKLGVDNVQGFSVAGPLLPENVPTWVQNHRARTHNERNILWTG